MLTPAQSKLNCSNRVCCLLLLESYHCVSASLITAKNAYASTIRTEILRLELVVVAVVVGIISLRFCQPYNCKECLRHYNQNPNRSNRVCCRCCCCVLFTEAGRARCLRECIDAMLLPVFVLKLFANLRVTQGGDFSQELCGWGGGKVLKSEAWGAGTTTPVYARFLCTLSDKLDTRRAVEREVRVQTAAIY